MDEGDVRLFMAIWEGWLFVVERDNSARLKSFLSLLQNSGSGSSLAADPVFLDLNRKLPGARIGTLYIRDLKGIGRHMAALVREDRDLVVHYAGTDPIPESARRITAVPTSEAASLAASIGTSRKKRASFFRSDGGSVANDPNEIKYHFLGQSEGLDLGPLPRSVIGIACLNAINYCPKNLGVLDLPLLFGNVRKRIIPGLAPPILGVIGSIDVDADGKRVTVPYAGIMVKLRDPSVSHDLDKLLGAMHFLATLGSLELGKSFFGTSEKQAGQTVFKVADFGSSLVRLIKDRFVAALANMPEPSGLRRIAYGRVGAWYVLCTQEAFLRQCAAVYANPSLGFSESEKYKNSRFQSCSNLVLTSFVDAPHISGLFALVTESLKDQADKYSSLQGSKKQNQEKKGEKPFKRLVDYTRVTMNYFLEFGNQWCFIHTLPTQVPKAKEDPKVAAAIDRARKQKGEPPRTDPECALKPLNWLSSSLRKTYSFTLQVWRETEGNPLGELRIVIGEIPHNLVGQADKRAAYP